MLIKNYVRILGGRLEDEKYFDNVTSLLQEAQKAISGSEVLTEEKRRELISRVRSIKTTLEGNRNKPWITSEEGRKALKALRIEVESLLRALRNLESEEGSLEELIKKLDSLRLSTRKVVEIIKK